jgi:hypothetical protein
MTTTDLVESIDSRVEELSKEIATLEAARKALVSNNGASARSQPKATRPARRRPSRVTAKTTGVVPAEKLEKLVADNDGLTMTALAKEAGGGRDQVLMLLRELEAAQRVRRSGQRGGTRWHAITDEQKILERAAELERRRKKAKQSAPDGA